MSGRAPGRVGLRPSGPADLAFVTGLERRPDHREIIGQWSDERHLAAIARSDGWEHWIVERSGEPAGFLIAQDGRTHYGGIYLKRVLVGDKDRGTGRLAVAAFLDLAFARPGTAFAWLNVRTGNARAQAVYRRLGFRRYDPSLAEAEALGRSAEAPGTHAFRMRIDRERWQASKGDRMDDTAGDIGQVAIVVSDVATALPFYRDALGLRFLFSAGDELAFLQSGGVRIMLTTPKGHGTPGANSVLYFRVQDVERAQAAIVARGAENERAPQLTARMPDHELWIGFVRDPDGNLVGLMEERRS